MRQFCVLPQPIWRLNLALFVLITAFSMLIFLPGCGSAFLAQPTLIPTDTSTPTLTITPTIVWFPPTDTPTPMANVTVQPTLDQKPSIGPELAADDFTNPALWSTSQTASGSAAFGSQELTLAISAPKAMLQSLSTQSLPDNYYLEITVDLSLCRGGDNYGLLLRAGPTGDTYRYAISCNGQVRTERLKNNQLAVLQGWTPSGQIPPGSPLVLRLGVWAAGSEMRFFVNDAYQFTVRDAVLSGGVVGVFARSASDTPVTVSFSGLALYSLGVLPTALPLPSETPQP